jgi:hypothetical protein
VAANIAVAQTDSQEDETVGLYSEHRVRRGETAAAEVANYRARIGLMASVDDFLRDDRLVSFALTAFGLDPKHQSTATIRGVLSSDLSDPSSLANQLGGSYDDLAAAFDFATDGSLLGPAPQSDAAVEELVYRYYESSGNGTSPAAAAFKTELYEARIASVTTVDDFLADAKLFEYALTAYGLDPTLETTAGIRLVLTSDLSDPSSFANTLPDTRYRTLAAAFNFLPDGTIAGGEAQTAAQIEDTTDLYFTHYGKEAADTDALETSYFNNRVVSTVSNGIVTLKKVDELLNDSRLYAYLLKSYDLDPETESKATIRRVLTSDIADPKSYANTLRDPRYRALAGAVNFAVDGTVTTPLEAQIDTDELATVRRYTALLPSGATTAERKAASDESTYYHEAINKVHSVDALIADKRLIAYVLKAYDLDEVKLSDFELKRILTSDPLDKRSYANSRGDTRYRELAGAFNFTPDGKISRAPVREAQTRNDMLATADLYLQQTLESDAGAQSEGVRLALYFRRKAPTIASAYSILADKALLEVVRTALKLPASTSQIDIDKQAQIISKRLKIEDLKDPKKLDKFLAQFAALYDINNNTAAVSSPASILFGTGSSGGVSEGLLGSLQGVRPGRT